jgi:hypothetical protein
MKENTTIEMYRRAVEEYLCSKEYYDWIEELRADYRITQYGEEEIAEAVRCYNCTSDESVDEPMWDLEDGPGNDIDTQTWELLEGVKDRNRVAEVGQAYDLIEADLIREIKTAAKSYPNLRCDEDGLWYMTENEEDDDRPMDYWKLFETFFLSEDELGPAEDSDDVIKSRSVKDLAAIWRGRLKDWAVDLCRTVSQEGF